jgi:hypothetical protein
MNFPADEEHRDSGVNWLGEIPSKWHVVALKVSLDEVNWLI